MWSCKNIYINKQTNKKNCTLLFMVKQHNIIIYYKDFNILSEEVHFK